MARQPVDSRYKRVLIFGRVYPATRDYLESLDEPNIGRAIDNIVMAHKALLKAIKPSVRTKFEHLARLPLD